MKDKNDIAKSGADKARVPETPIIDADDELTPEAAATAANQLPPGEQLNQFEKDMELHDGGNLPA